MPFGAPLRHAGDLGGVRACVAAFKRHERHAFDLFNRRSEFKYMVRWGRFAQLLAGRARARDYEFSGPDFHAPPARQYGPSPWVREYYLTVGGGSRAVHAVPLFDARSCIRVGQRTPIMGFLPLERDWYKNEERKVQPWIGRPYGAYLEPGVTLL